MRRGDEIHAATVPIELTDRQVRLGTAPVRAMPTLWPAASGPSAVGRHVRARRHPIAHAVPLSVSPDGVASPEPAAPMKPNVTEPPAGMVALYGALVAATCRPD